MAADHAGPPLSGGLAVLLAGGQDQLPEEHGEHAEQAQPAQPAETEGQEAQGGQGAGTPASRGQSVGPVRFR
jgi:hypothetical protein